MRLIIHCLIICINISNSLLWTQKSSPVLPNGARNAPVSGAWNKSIWILGGSLSTDSIEYKIDSDEFVAHSSSAYDIHASSQAFTQIESNIYYYTNYPNDYIITFNMISKTYNNAAVPKKDQLLEHPCLTNVQQQYLLALGGRTEGSLLYKNGFHIFDFLTGEWKVDGPSMPEARYGHTCQINSNGYLYVIGGKQSDSGMLSTVDVIDINDIDNINNKAWMTLPHRLSIPRDGVVSVIHLNLIYVIGGYFSSYRDVVDVIDTNNNIIYSESNLVSKCARAGVAIGYDNILYVIGGTSLDTIQYAQLPIHMPTHNPTYSPTHMPTHNPTYSPTHMSTHHPTYSPTYMPSTAPTQNLIEIKYLHQMRCDNLLENKKLEYDITLTGCSQRCSELGTDCKVINYFNFFKSTNDSRCYLFDNLCNVKVDENNNNKSIIAYKTLGFECNDYPVDWTDAISDSCDYYKSSNWCNHGNLIRDENEFINLMDSIYGLTAMETCCECDGGIILFDNVMLSKDNGWITFETDVLCQSTTNMYFNTTLRVWDNLILYQLCEELGVIDCRYLIDTEFNQFIPNQYNHTLYICNTYNAPITDLNQFIFEIILDEINEERITFINGLWFDIDIHYYSSEIDIKYKNVTECMSDVMEPKNETYRYGMHPCSVLDTVNPTLNPTRNPTLNPTLTLNPTANPLPDTTLQVTILTDRTLNPKLFENNGSKSAIWMYSVIVILSIIVCLCGIAVIALLFCKRNNGNKRMINEQIEMTENDEIKHMDQENRLNTENANPFNEKEGVAGDTKPKPSAPDEL